MATLDLELITPKFTEDDKAEIIVGIENLLKSKGYTVNKISKTLFGGFMLYLSKEKDE